MAVKTLKQSKMRIGADSCHVALLKQDDGETLSYDAPVALTGTMKITITPNSSSETAFYDNGPGETAATMGAIEVSFEKSALSTEEQAYVLGHTVDANGTLISGADDMPPELAFGFRYLHSDGTYTYVWLLKGSFAEPEEETSTKGESVEFQNSVITGNFVKTNKKFKFETAGTDGSSKVTIEKQAWKFALSEANASEAGKAAIKTWFDAVYAPPTPSLP